jgi:hypothetical protein
VARLTCRGFSTLHRGRILNDALPLDAGLAKPDYRFELKIISIFVFDFTPFYAMVYIFQFGNGTTCRF